MSLYQIHRGLVAALCALGLTTLTSTARADEPARLAEGIRLYEQDSYEEAHRMLQGIDAAGLSDSQRASLEQYRGLAAFAAGQYQKAVADLHTAQSGLATRDHEAVKQRCAQVLMNDFASSQLKSQARGLLADVARAEKRTVRLAAQETRTPGQRADALVQQAREAMGRGDYNAASAMFRDALQLVPGHPDAVRGLEQIQAHRRVESAPSDAPIRLIDQIQQRREILWQRAVATYREAERNIQALVVENRFEEADLQLKLARETIESARQYAEPLSKYETLRAEYEALATSVEERERAYNEQRAMEIRSQLEEQTRIQQVEIEEKRRREVDRLMELVEQKKADRDFAGAAQVLRQVLAIDPKNAEAEWLMLELEDIASIRAQVDYRERLEKETRDMLIETEEAKIPWSEELRYPDNWPELIRRPGRRVPGDYPLEGEDGDFEQSFQSRIPEISMRQEPLEQALRQVADAGDLNVVPNWRDLATAGVTPDTPVTLELKNITVRRALTEILEQVDGGNASRMGFNARDGVVKVATKDFLNRDVYTRVYPVKDLIQPRRIFDDAPEMDLRHTTRRGRRDKKKSDGPVFHGNPEEGAYAEVEFDRNEMNELINLIKTHVAPGTWQSQGGAHASIQAQNDGNLVVTQTAAAHRDIFNLLEQLREDNAVQIAIEARFLTVSSNFLEDMGIDLDIILNNGNAGFDHQGSLVEGFAIDPATGGQLLLPRNFTRLGFTPAVAPFGAAITQAGAVQPYTDVAFVPGNTGSSGNFFSPLPIANNSSAYTAPSRLQSDIAGSFAGTNLAPAMQVAGSFLDNIQVDFLLRATQADNRTSTLVAPKLILTNGQQAWIAVTNQQNFVSELQPVVATGAAAQAPITQTIDTGAVLNVQATASPDRRYVTMNLEPGVGRLIAINTFQFTGSPISGVGASGFVQLPVVQRQQVKTTVTVPDGGTLLVGGQKLTFENEVEAGVPVLSKIPVLKRFYSSRAVVKDEQVLLILIKPQVLIQEEQEELAYPTLGSAD